MTSLDTFIRHRLSMAENTLLDSLIDIDSLASFDRRWTQLQTSIDDALAKNALNASTVNMAHTVAARINIIANSFLQVEAVAEELNSCMIDEASSIIAGAAVVDFSKKQNNFDTHESKLSHELSERDNSSPLPPFIAPAYSWLLKNLHNPYPAKDVKESIANNTNTSFENVSAWFTNVRRRMGWTAVCRQHFHNCRADALDAAYRALVKEDPKRELTPNIVHAFMVVKVAAEGLYSSKFKRSALAGQLDVVVKDMTDGDRLRMEKMKSQEADDTKKRKAMDKEQRRQERAEQRELLKAAGRASKSYPSPVGSPHGSPVPILEDSFTDESDDENDQVVFPITFADSNRWASSSSASTMPAPCRGERPFKRHRSDSKEPETVATPSISALPSPPSEVDINHGVFDYWSPEVVEVPVALNAPSLPAPAQSHSRKRRLSDGASQGAPKRPRGVVGPRLHAVSDPLPKTNQPADDFNAWLMGNFEIPAAVADEVSDPSTLLDVDVECYNWSSMQDCYKQPVDDTEMFGESGRRLLSDIISLILFVSASPPYSMQAYNCFNMDSNPLSTTDINSLSTGDNLEELYQNFFGTNSHYPPPYSPQLVDSDPSTLACLTSDSGITSAPPSMSVSDDLFSGGGAWSHLPSYTDVIGSFNPSSVHSFMPESAHPLNLSSILSEIDLSMLQLPTSSPQDIPRPNEEATRLADKQAKLEQLKMLEEAKRRLEAELASEA
ncbi:hypothetical protein SERLA73DRAFT_156557 [Serpula lacrymans var. lacrymans S7.3]|uniref:Homeobox domain-containing protein n=1 Tax=Serpula lacrymans var. lacrymans (strain S7.3) TaxID=936435 RepID=F8QEZ5_SERL3|nr:hypothetical protein SERLA73DRAFT_156557 [Serpula lacrymans var. lacrymans S7.3]